MIQTFVHRFVSTNKQATIHPRNQKHAQKCAQEDAFYEGEQADTCIQEDSEKAEHVVSISKITTEKLL